MTQKILVTGATGNISSLVLPQLKDKGVQVRVLLKNDAKAADFKSQGFEVVIGDYSNVAALKTAMQGIDACFLVAPMHSESHTWTQSFLEVAQEFPTMRIVRLSAIKANVNGPTNNTKLHGQSDLALTAGKNPWVCLQPSNFMQNLLWSAGTILGEGKIYLGQGEGKVGLIDTRDVADCVVSCLLDNSWDFGTYNLTGPAVLTMGECAQTLGTVLGREISYVPVDGATVEKNIAAMGLGTWFQQTLRQYGDAYAAGFGNHTNGLVQKITGHAPRSFETFAKEVFLPLTKK